MPLQAAVPVLDDRRYDDIVAEIRTRIPRYTPEWRPQWSDLNDSDPGVILAQTFAWLADMLLYRMDQVPELQYLKFLQLVGIELLPAQPASTEITLAVAAGVTTPTVLVPPRTQASAASDDGTPIVFETDSALTALTAELRAVQAYDGAVYEDETSTNQDPAANPDGFFPFGEAPREDGALVLGFAFPDTYPTPTVFTPVPIDLAAFAVDSRGSSRVLEFSTAASRAYPPAKLQW